MKSLVLILAATLGLSACETTGNNVSGNPRKGA